MKKIYYFLLALIAAPGFGQSTLTVNCYNSDTVYNSFLIDNNIIEYSLCGLQPAFYVGVIDPSTCSAWGTNYNGANPGHSFGNMNEGTCRQRVEHYFVFNANDSLQLAGMLNMLQQIPAGHSILIYTPMFYDYSMANTANSNLTDELEAKWNPGVIQGNEIMILYGVQGNTASFVEETTQNAGKVSFSTQICNSLSVNQQVKNDQLFLKQDGTTLILNPDLAIDNLQILDATGKEVSFVRTENTIHLQNGISQGIYLFQATAAGKCYRSKLLISF